MKFIKEHNLVVWRFHDHSHRRQPDGVQAGMLRALGWYVADGQAPHGGHATRDDARPGWPLTSGRRLDAHALRVVGRPDMAVTNVALVPGAAGFAMHREALQRDDVQVLVIGEAREWETVEYVDDAVAAGQNKALIIIGHIPSEQAGMEECARWLKSVRDGGARGVRAGHRPVLAPAAECVPLEAVSMVLGGDDVCPRLRRGNGTRDTEG